MLVVREVKVYWKKALRSTSLSISDVLADCSGAYRVAAIVRSSLNVAVDVQVVGDSIPQPSNPFPLGAWETCNAGVDMSINMDFDDWLPFIGVLVKTPIQAESGDLAVSLFIQEEKG